MIKYWKGSKVWTSTQSTKLNQIEPQQLEASSIKFGLVNESVQNFGVNRHAKKLGTVAISETDKTPFFSEAKLVKEDPLRIAKRKRVDYGNVFTKDKSEHLKIT